MTTPPSGYGPPPGYAAPTSGGPPAGKQRLRGRTPLRLSIIFFVVAIGLFVAGGIVAATKSLGKVNDFARVDVSAGSGSVHLDRTGDYVAYYEASDVTSSTKRVPIVLIRLTSPSGKQTVLKTFYGGRKISNATGNDDIKKLTYQYKGHNGIALYQFRLTEKGTYKVALQPVGGLSPAPGADIALGESIAGGTVLAGALILIGVLLLVTAIILLIVGLVRRRRHKKELRAGYGYQQQSYPPQAYPQTGYPQGGPPPGYPPQSGPPPGYSPQGGPPPGYPPQEEQPRS